jgi:hypothetical protein
MVSDIQKKGRGASGGQRIDDHSFWAGGKSKESPMPMNSKMKQFSSAEGAGSEMDYEDTTEKIKSQQEMGVKKLKGYPQKPGYRN